ncbi:hypothetical protein PR202_gb10043 [Eleusine coracana subsp. coracana]|uniref:SAC domain-containing protein n=1 Tax=Eleusine coracana subsp. coracana TaxID=191504 RepID=A0AAV5EJE2_ELECO|nr:hypothetical protein PR202_gb10043 [Eleusine coracana subsp. coracana]
MAAAMEQEAEATCLQSFELYESESRLYILGTNSDKTFWRLLKINKSEPSELDIDECSTVYTQNEYPDLLNGLNEDHRSTGGDKFSISGKDIMLTLISRRSRHYAGTRYLKRGVNEKGRVANDVETEQIVYEAVPGPVEVSSVVQNRGSIPLFWSQETSKLNIKPNIILHEMDNNYEATRLHFENLRGRYGDPIIILNLIKTHERRESILRREFDKAIRIINKNLPEENHLKFLHWDLHKNSQGKPTNVLDVLLKVAFRALSLTEFFYCQVAPRSETAEHWPALLSSIDPYICDNNSNSDNTECTDIAGDISQEDISGSSDSSGALGHQLHALGIIESPELGLESPLAHHLMHFYERMGDTLAVQYSGSAAHNKCDK